MQLLVIAKSKECPEGHFRILFGEASMKNDAVHFQVHPAVSVVTFHEEFDDIVQAFENVSAWSVPVDLKEPTSWKEHHGMPVLNLHRPSEYLRFWKEISVEEIRIRLAVPPCPYPDDALDN